MLRKKSQNKLQNRKELLLLSLSQSFSAKQLNYISRNHINMCCTGSFTDDGIAFLWGPDVACTGMARCLSLQY